MQRFYYNDINLLILILDPEEAEVISGYELTPARLNEFLDSLTSTFRVAIGIDNESGFSWTKFPTYFVSGTEDKPLPYHLNDGKSEFCKCALVVITIELWYWLL